MDKQVNGKQKASEVGGLCTHEQDRSFCAYKAQPTSKDYSSNYCTAHQWAHTVGYNARIHQGDVAGSLRYSLNGFVKLPKALRQLALKAKIAGAPVVPAQEVKSFLAMVSAVEKGTSNQSTYIKEFQTARKSQMKEENTKKLIALKSKVTKAELRAIKSLRARVGDDPELLAALAEEM